MRDVQQPSVLRKCFFYLSIIIYFLILFYPIRCCVAHQKCNQPDIHLRRKHFENFLRFGFNEHEIAEQDSNCFEHNANVQVRFEALDAIR